MQRYPFLASAVGAIATIVITAPVAQANSRICRQLQNEARELGQMGSGASRASLQRELDRAERQVRRAGCSGFQLIFGGLAKRQCHTLRAKMNRLRQEVRSTNYRPLPNRRLRKVEAEMRRHGCSSNRSQQARRASGYQTLCVRTCDGYYFPIGFSTPKSELKRDQAACNSFYPDGTAELYVRPSGTDEAAAMVSLHGKDYTAQPFAFAYRSTYQPACAATFRASVKAGDEEMQQGVVIKASAIVPIPVPRPSSTDDAKSVANSSHRVSVAAFADARPEIRVVGPATPYLVSKPADESIARVAANSAPKRVAPDAPNIGESWLDRISSLIALAAQADEGG